MKSLSILVLLLLPIFNLSAQNKPVSDSLKVVMNKAHDTTKVNVYAQLSWEYKDSDLAKSIYLGKKAVSMAKTANYMKGACNTLVKLSAIYLENKDFDNAIIAGNEALEIAKTSGEISQVMNSSRILAQIYGQKGEIDQAMQVLEKSLGIVEELSRQERKKMKEHLAAELFERLKQKEEEFSNQAASLSSRFYYSLFFIFILIVALALFILRMLSLKSSVDIKRKMENSLKEENQRLGQEKLAAQKQLGLYKHQQYEETLRIKNELKAISEEKQKLEIEFKNKELVSSALYTIQKNEVLTEVESRLEYLGKSLDTPTKDRVKDICQLISYHTNLDEEWEKMKMIFDQLHPHFYDRLQEQYPALTPSELRHCVYMKINLNSKEIARFLNIGAKAIQMSRYRIKKKMDLPEEVNLIEYLQNY